jgi:nitroreductase
MMENVRMNDALLAALETRRSVKPDRLEAPAPTGAELDRLLAIAARVPDHKKLVPWRFIVFEGEARAAAGEIFAAACQAEEKDPSHVRLETERQRFLRAPLVVAVVSRIAKRPGAPEWEQILSAGAAAFNLCLAANAAGYGTSWLTEWIAYSPFVKEKLGLAENERIAGFVHIGTPKEKPEERDRPSLADIVTRWGA